MSILYEDRYLVCDDDAVTIKEYFFPFGSKRIAYAEIRKLEEQELTLLDGKLRFWGMGFEPKWYHIDWQRHTKSKSMVLDIGEWIKPALTPEDHEVVLTVLKEKIRQAQKGA